MELRRRIRAACIHHGIEPAELSGWFYAATPRGLKIAEAGEYGDPKLGSLDEGLRQTIARLGIDVVSLDPFVKAHGVEENANNAIDFVADALARIALECNCAVDAPHHISKGGGVAGDADKARGASAFKDAARLVYTLTPMTAAEAEMFGIIESERRSFVRLDSAKVNIAPPSDKAQWFRLVGVSLDNGNADYPNGDDVQSIEPWEPPDALRDMTPEIEARVFARIEQGLPDGRRYSAQGNAKEDQRAWTLLVGPLPVTEGQARQIIRGWLAKGKLSEGLYHDPVERKQRKGLFIAGQKRTGLGAQEGANEG